MRAAKSLIVATIGVAAMAMAGCERSAPPPVSQAPPPAQPSAEAQPAPADQAQPAAAQEPPVVDEAVPDQPDIYVQTAPPPPVVEVEPVPPGPDYVWIGGFWDWNVPQNRYVWTRGHYEHSRPNAVWVAPHYDAAAHRFSHGHWSGRH